MNCAFAVDGILCISLREREDRRMLLAETLDCLNAEVEFLLVERDVEDSQRGCFKSHQKCAELMLDRGWSRVLILEDDVLFNTFDCEAVTRVNNYLRRYEPPVFYLGIMLGKLWPTWSKGVAACRAQGTHAYILSAEAAEVVVAERYCKQGIDTFIKRRFPGRTAFPMLCQQQPESVGKSDLDFWRMGDTVKDEVFWQRNYKKQYFEWWRNIYKLFYFSWLKF